MNLRAFFLAACAAAALAQCAPDVPAGRRIEASAVVVSPHPWPTPLVLAGDAPPRIAAVWMNETTMSTGSDWYGRVVASTNTASVEVRTESFSFVADRTAFGDFSFRQHLLDMVPPYRRGYWLLIVARNAAGQQDAVTIPISFAR